MEHSREPRRDCLLRWLAILGQGSFAQVDASLTNHLQTQCSPLTRQQPACAEISLEFVQRENAIQREERNPMQNRESQDARRGREVRAPRISFAATALTLCMIVAGPWAGAADAPKTPSGAPGKPQPATAFPAGPAAPRPEALGITFVEGSSSTVLMERDGKKYLVDLVSHQVKEVDSPSALSAVASAPAQTAAAAQGPSQAMVAGQQTKQGKPNIYEPGDDVIFSLPTGRRLERHGVYINFNHRFAFDPAFQGASRGHVLAGLDNFSISSFGFRYGVTEKFSIAAYRSPSVIGRPIQFTAGYNLLDEHDGHPLNAVFRFSVEGQNDFSKNFTADIEGIFSKSLTKRAQIYVVPTISLNNRPLPPPPPTIESPPPDFPGFNTFALGIGGALDVRPTVALVAEVIPTLVNGRDLGIHRPAYAFGIQKKIWRHAFTFGFTNSPGTTVSQRAGTVASYLNSPSADTPSGLFIGFDLTRQIY
jgi:hypothetical protein